MSRTVGSYDEGTEKQVQQNASCERSSVNMDWVCWQLDGMISSMDGSSPQASSSFSLAHGLKGTLAGGNRWMHLGQSTKRGNRLPYERRKNTTEANTMHTHARMHSSNICMRET
mmetsp:Transcript_2542/g.5731  ORF Transcript_2542/g.5731 Transcript_2542/m.5731 type:complete len:114 (+) Transcript_2542:958-1299(+)